MRRCYECDATVLRGEGGVMASGLLFCSEDCAVIHEGSVLLARDAAFDRAFAEYELGQYRVEGGR